ncbi:HpcH/HpaI aldolase/citrate lyase family protein [Actinophytocola sp.]|uniref:HpcH/HpaI aldolase/citrate lyase family protein n=1 Tax=Actinophytocola sp. TaxID=1872138 RepID=UPI003D6B2ABB
MTRGLARSVLITPATSERMLERAAGSAADIVVIDLEDSVTASDKAAARGRAVAAVRGLDWGGSSVACRINALDGRWGAADLDALLGECADLLDSVVVPKVRLPEDLAPVRGVHASVMVEDARAYAFLREICAVDGVRSLIFGHGDFAASLGVASAVLTPGAAPDPAGPFPSVRAHFAVMVKAFGHVAVDTPYPDFHDPDGFRAEARWAKSAGFDGKLCIHPDQVPLANDVFGPTGTELAAAAEMIQAFEVQEASVFAWRGRMVDEVALRVARDTWERGRQAGLV